MKATILPIIIALFLCLNLFSQTIIFQENFDSYSTGIGIASQSLSWQTWSYTTSTAEDALISGEHFSSGDKSLNIRNDNDILYYFGSRVSGAYDVEFKMYIKQGNGAYLNVEHGNRSSYAFQVCFMENNQVWFDNGSDSVQLAGFNTDEWFAIRLSIDLNNDTLIVYKNDTAVGGFDFSTAMDSQPQNALGYIDFYGINNYPVLGINNSDFFIDDFTFTEVTPPEPVNGCDQLNYFATAAQVNYGYYSDLDSYGSVIATSGNYDDSNSGPVDIGFTFKFNCQDFTQFILNTNGFIKLGNTPPSSAALFYKEANTLEGGIFNSNNPEDVNLISPFNHDLMEGTETPEYRVYTEGTSPYRICTIQFKNLRDKTSSPAQQYDNIEFQIKLYETINIIEFVYGEWIPSANASALKTSACGLKGSTFSDEDLLVVTKGSNKGWFEASFSNANYNVNTLNFGNPPDRPIPYSGTTYRFVPAYNTDLMVNEIYALGTSSALYSNPQVLSASISNIGMSVLSNIQVKLNIDGDNIFNDTATIPVIYPKTNVTVTFDPFISYNLGTNLIRVSLPEDDGNEDNQKYRPQYVTESLVRYASDVEPDINWGYAANQGGIFLTKYHVNGTAFVYSVDAYLTDISSVGMPVYAILMDANGTITGQSAEYIIQEADLSAWHSFIINNPPTMSDVNFYAGLAVPPAATAYYPMGVQIEYPCRSDAYFWSPIGGGSINRSYNRFMIGVTLDNLTGIKEPYGSTAGIQLFPNPADDYITIAALPEPAMAKIYSCNGVLLKTYALNQMKNDLYINDLLEGIYIIKLESEKGAIVKKFIKR